MRCITASICFIHLNNHAQHRWYRGNQDGGHVINNLRYTDDTVMIAESKNQLQQLMDTLVK